MDAALTLDFRVERDDGGAVDGGGVAQFLVERRLVVKAGRETERHVFVERRDGSQRDAWRHDGFVVVAPVGHAQTVVQREIPRVLTVGMESVGVLHVGFSTG